MIIKDIFTEEAYDISVEGDNFGEDFLIHIDGKALRLSKDEWERIKSFIDNSIEFIGNN
jgi:hypothetical protein